MAPGLFFLPQKDWENLVFLASLIPRICHNVNRVCYLAGKPLKEAHFPSDTTPTTLSQHVLSKLRECDSIATSVMEKHGANKHISQMPVVLIPVHFDREPYSTKVGTQS